MRLLLFIVSVIVCFWHNAVIFVNGLDVSPSTIVQSPDLGGIFIEETNVEEKLAWQQIISTQKELNKYLHVSGKEELIKLQLMIRLAYGLQVFDRNYHKGAHLKQIAADLFVESLRILSRENFDLNDVGNDVIQMKISVLSWLGTLQKELGQVDSAILTITNLIESINEQLQSTKNISDTYKKFWHERLRSELLQRSTVYRMLHQEQDALHDLYSVLSLYEECINLDTLPKNQPEECLSSHAALSYSTYSPNELQHDLDKYSHFVELMEKVALNDLSKVLDDGISIEIGLLHYNYNLTAVKRIIPNANQLNTSKIREFNKENGFNAASFIAMRFFAQFEILDKILDLLTISNESECEVNADQDKIEVVRFKAWRYLELANELHIRGTFPDYNVMDSVKQLKQIKRVFNRDLLQLTSNQSFADVSREKNSIFVVGLPRSGSTLTEKILGSHSLICGLGEDTYFNTQMTGFRANLVDRINLLSSDRDLLQTFLNNESLRILNLQIGSVYNTKNSSIVVDKMLFNFLNLGFIHMLLPKAKIVHVYKKNVKDAIFSLYRKQFQGDTSPYSYNLIYLQVYIKVYKQFINYFAELLPGLILDFPYEDLVERPESQARKLIDFVGVPFEPTILNFMRTKPDNGDKDSSVVHTHSQFQVSKPLYKSSIESYKKYEIYLQPYLLENLIENEA